MSYNPLVNALNPQTNSLRVEGNLGVVLTQSDKDKINSAVDLSIVITHSDLGTVDERVNTITYSSVSVGKTYIETYNYVGTPGNYTLTSITSA